MVKSQRVTNIMGGLNVKVGKERENEIVGNFGLGYRKPKMDPVGHSKRVNNQQRIVLGAPKTRVDIQKRRYKELDWLRNYHQKAQKRSSAL